MSNLLSFIKFLITEYFLVILKFIFIHVTYLLMDTVLLLNYLCVMYIADGCLFVYLRSYYALFIFCYKTFDKKNWHQLILLTRKQGKKTF